MESSSNFHVPSKMLDDFLLNVFRRITFGSISDELLKDLCWNKMFINNSKEFFSISLFLEINITELQFFDGAICQDLCFRKFHGDFCLNAPRSEKVSKFKVGSAEFDNVVL